MIQTRTIHNMFYIEIHLNIMYADSSEYGLMTPICIHRSVSFTYMGLSNFP